MNGLLRDGTLLRFSGTTTPARVIRLLGGGGQGQVFEVEFAGEPMALKWVFPSSLARDPGLVFERARFNRRTGFEETSYRFARPVKPKPPRK